MSWDKIITEPCIVNIGGTGDCSGGVSPPGPDPRCSDPAFRAAHPELCNDIDPNCNDPAFRLEHPELCEGMQVLILKPGLATVCTPLGITFKAFVYANGVEMEVSTGVTFGSSDLYVMQIGAVSGKASSVAAGTVTISAKWQDLTAFAQITVVDGDICCDGTEVGMLVLLDNSASMKRAFAFPYGNRINFAKNVAKNFFSTINTLKDLGALMTFNESGQLIQGFSNDLTELKNKTSAVAASSLGTDLGDALKDAIDYVNTKASLTQRVIVLITDGDNHGMDPRVIADEFISGGGILVVVGVRSFGVGFDTLTLIASGGYFLNAINTNADDIDSQLSGLKGYFCAGNCVPPGDVVIPRAQLDYAEFANWDVISGKVDLIGGESPYELFDFRPGHGLYLDMVGSSVPLLGTIQTKDPIAFTVGVPYRLRFKMAGNQRTDTGVFTVKVKIKDVSSATTLLDEDVTISDFRQDFTEFDYDFTPGSSLSGKISFQTTVTPTMFKPVPAPVGLLLDDVQLIENPGAAHDILFQDDFNAENALYIPPDCGMGTIVLESGGFGYGYDCYGSGCLTSPVGAQVPDPIPQEDTFESDLGSGGGGGGSTPQPSSGPSKTYVDSGDQAVIAELQAYIDFLIASGGFQGPQGPQGEPGSGGGGGTGDGVQFIIGSPEGVAAANASTLIWDLAGQALYLKEAGSGTTGWKLLLITGGDPYVGVIGGGGNGGVTLGSGDPEGVEVADPGTLWWDVSGQSLHIKESGTGVAGWKLLLVTGGNPYVGVIGSGGSGLTIGNGNPEGAEMADPGQLFWDITGQSLHLKESGSGDTGWKQLLAI